MKSLTPSARRRVRSLSLWFIVGIVVSQMVVPIRLLERSAHAQTVQSETSARKVQPEAPQKGAPEGLNLPNLDDVRSRAQVEPQIQPPIASSMRSKRKPLLPWPKKRVGDPGTTGTGIGSNREATTEQNTVARAELPKDERAAKSLTRLNHASNLKANRRATASSPTAVGDYDYVTNFLTRAIGNANDYGYWTDILRSALPQGADVTVTAAKELGNTIFNSVQYTSRANRDCSNSTNSHNYVEDLYWTYLMRAPDQAGWDFWAHECEVNGRDAVRAGMDQSIEFHDLMASLYASGSITNNFGSLATARVDPFNQTGDQLRARDAEWNVPLINLPGRAGLDLGLGLSYSSLVYTRSGPYLYFDEDSSSISPGFRLGFASIQGPQFDATVFDASGGRKIYMLISSSGQRVELRQVGTTNVYEAADSSYLQLTDNGSSLLLRTPDGPQMSYSSYANGWQATEVKDRNGNYLTITNDWRGDILTVTDTLNRTLTFHLDSNGNLESITQSGITQPLITFGWGSALTMNVDGFTAASVVGISTGEQIPVLRQVGLDDGSYFTFDYTTAGQVNMVRRFTYPDNIQRSSVAYDYDSSISDCPRLTQTRVSAESWTGLNGVPSEVTTQFSVVYDGSHQMTAPDGTIYKDFYGTGYQKGLVTQSQIWSGGYNQKTTTTSYTQDNTSVSYQTNPRVIETNIYDAQGNHRRTTIAYTNYSLPSDVYEYAADATTVLRRSHTDYDLTSTYISASRRIIGLPSAQYVCDGAGGATPCSNSSGSSLVSKVGYQYDEGSLQSVTPVQHDDTNFGSSFVAGRGNLTSVWRYDVNNLAQYTANSIAYNTAGAAVSATDASSHTSTISYADSFSTDGTSVSNPAFVTLAYPTTLTDADGNNSYLRYNYDNGLRTRAQGPPPTNPSTGQPYASWAAQKTKYDSARRVEKVSNEFTGAYTRYVYGPNYTQSFSTVNNIADEAYSIKVFNGAGQTITAAGFHPGSTGGYWGQLTRYDAMGRAVQQTNPTEMNATSVPSGDDSAGWQFNVANTFDWKGRPLRTYNMDGTYKEASYAGCGCAGGEVVTITDEVSRQQKIYSDILGRQWKTEVMNGSTVYSATVSTLNARDQVTQIRQWAGAENGGGAYQDTTMSYDGYGRLQNRHLPEENTGTFTVYAYNSDDTVQSITDARGACANYTYNSRHLVTAITYSAPSGITAAPNVTFGYDGSGNRTSMTDGLGSVSYSYNQLSQMIGETRVLSGVGSFTLGYQYNLTGQLTTLSDPFGATLNYGFDTASRLNAVSGSGYGSISQFASNIKYRAWGAVKSTTYDSLRSLAVGYNSRMNVTSFHVVGQYYTVGSDYQYFADGRISYSHDLTESKFDRSYSYDNVARLVSSLSGDQARGGSSADGPYMQTYSFDVFNNLTGRTGRDWSHNLSPVSFTYNGSTNRNSQWQYDASGSITGQGTRQYAYDASGRQVSTSETGGSAMTQAFDGDGLPAKRTTGGSTEYRIRSSVLNGAAIADLTSAGQVFRRYVYANGQILATYDDVYHQANWQHRTPSNNSEFGSLSGGAGGIRGQEYDPLGIKMSLDDPYADGGSGGYGNWAGGNGVPSDLTTGCTWEGMAIGCQFAIKFTGWLGVAGRVRVVSDIPGLSTPQNQTSWVRSRVRSDDEEYGDWSEGDLQDFKNFVSRPDTNQTSVVRTHHSKWQKPTPQTPCHTMADVAQNEANDAIFQNPKNARAALSVFDQRFSTLYVGGPFYDGIHAYPLRGGDLGKINRNSPITGGDGFRNEYKDSGSNPNPKIAGPDADQTHHYAAYLSMGVNKAVGTLAWGLRGEDNQGDRNLSLAAYRMGAQLHDHPGRLKLIGLWIRLSICDGPGHGLYY